MDILD
jgi:hypothetical protein